MNAMRIGYDSTSLVGNRAGVGKYTQQLLTHLADRHNDHEYVLLSNRSIDLASLPTTAALRAEVEPFPSRLVWMQSVLPGMIRRNRLQICHFPNSVAPLSSPVPYVVTIHDMTLSILPHHHPVRRRFVVRCLIPLVARRAQRVITVSVNAQRDIVRLLKLPAERVCVIHEAAAPHFKPASQAEQERVRQRYGLSGPYLLYVGTLEPRKNLVRLMRAWHTLWQRGAIPHRLVIGGGAGWQFAPIYRAAAELNCGDAIYFTGYLPDADLPALYSAADGFAFPSLYEGFGLPVVEALACGTPTLISTTPALVEVAGTAALQADPLSIDSLADGIERLLTDGALRDDLRMRGLRRAASFSWVETARRTLELYGEVVHSPVMLRSEIATNPATDEF